MSWKDGNLICDWCNLIVISQEKVTASDIEFHIGWTKCSKCVSKQDKLPKSGTIEDLLKTDFYAPNDPIRSFLKKES